MGLRRLRNGTISNCEAQYFVPLRQVFRETPFLSLRLRVCALLSAPRFSLSICQALCQVLIKVGSGLLQSSPLPQSYINCLFVLIEVHIKFKEILDGLPPKRPRSRLETYAKLIIELRRDRTYRDIAHILAEKCQIQVTASEVHDFVRARSRINGRSARRIATDSTKTAQTARIAPNTRKFSADDEARRKIGGQVKRETLLCVLGNRNR